MWGPLIFGLAGFLAGIVAGSCYWLLAMSRAASKAVRLYRAGRAKLAAAEQLLAANEGLRAAADRKLAAARTLAAFNARVEVLRGFVGPAARN